MTIETSINALSQQHVYHKIEYISQKLDSKIPDISSMSHGLFDGRVAGHMTWGLRDRSWSRMGGVSVEGRGSFMDVQGFLDIPEPTKVMEILIFGLLL